jgi:hypothetical protein
LEMPSLDDARDMTVEHFWEPEEIEHAAWTQPPPNTHTMTRVFQVLTLFFLIISCTSKKTKLILIHIDYYSKIKGKKSKKYDRLKIIVLENWK